MNQRAKKYSEVEGNIKHNNFMSSKVCVALPRMSRFLTVLLLSATLSVCWRSVVAKTSCSEENDEWRCTSGECIPKAYMCNGTKQCRDGSDETEKLCKDMECSDASFRCSYGACISLKLVCDGVVDCVDKSDEDSGSCLKRRNDLPDDGIDDETRRKNCADWGQMKCWSGQCVRISDKCNGIRDCADGSDERSSLCKTMLCNKQQFQCGYGACIPKQAKCNGTQECWDGTDELEKLCKKKVNSTLTPTTKLNLSIVTESIVNPSIIVYDFKASENLKNTTTQTTTNHVQIENKEFKTTNNIEKPLYKGNETKSTPKTSSRHPIATTSAENFGMDLNEIASTNLMKPTTEANKIKKYAEDDLQITTPKIKVTTKLPTLITNGSFKIDISRYPSSKQAPNFETNLNSSIDNSLVSNSSDQIPLISRPSTEIVPPIVKHPGSLTGISELEINTSKVETTARPQTVGTITPDTIILPPTTIPTKHQQPTPNQYNTTKPTTIFPPTTITTKRQQPTPNQYNTTKPTTTFPPTTTTTKRQQPTPNQYNNTKSTTIFPPTTTTTKRQQPTPNQYNNTKSTTIFPPATTTTKRQQPTSNQYNTTKPRTTFPSTTTTTERQQPTPNRYNNTKPTTIFPPSTITTIPQQFTPNQYNTTKPTTTLPPTTITTKRQQTVFSTNKPIKECVLRNCDHPLFCKISFPGPRNSEITIVNKGRLSLIVGSQVIFNCAEGYDLEGANRLTCTPTGWSHSSPSCISYCDADFIYNCRPPLKCLFEQSNSRSKIFITKEFKQRVREHSHISFACDKGYLHEGPTMRKCTARGWSNEIPRCINYCDISELEPLNSPLKCKVFDSNIQRLKDYQYSVWNKKIKERSYFEFTCEDGYKLDGENRSTCMNNGWSSAAPTCIRSCDLSLVSPCTAPLLCHHNHKRSFINLRNWADVVLPGVHVDYRCEDGYELDGTKVITCTNDGWSNRIPTCKETVCDASILADCTYPLKCEIYDRTIRKYNRINRGVIQELSNDENLYINCEDGFTLQGSQYLHCRGGKWDGIMPKCIVPTCNVNLLPKCGNPLICTAYHDSLGSGQQITNNYWNRRETYPQDTVVVLDCPYGYTLKGSKEITCDLYSWKYEHGTYSSECQKNSKTCEQEIVDNCIYPMICERFESEFNDFVTIKFSCENGYMLDGGNSLTCTDDKWDHNMPKCITHSCSGHLIPSCKYPLNCTLFDSKSKSERIITDITKSTNYALNTQIIFGCANGYKLTGEEQTICSSNGWSHEQSLKLPQCTSPCDADIFGNCEEPLNCFCLPPKHNKWFQVTSAYLIHEVRENYLVDFRCNEGFRLEGPRRMKCTSRGWDQPVPKCVPYPQY
ncbi:uncharacterized protein LOC114803524 isoform X2 [Zeugodacus cucurbitae]|uniref:uncharacterized protein LOC114803524 isoform X2 n=1 Tax=Zeugodacus cucurbitae TaxID=28588 RepID=UPI0023D9281C|nr:uncharacterized protein LOC114803524 isoform X2 [Zeugodacus cucurbitae]